MFWKGLTSIAHNLGAPAYHAKTIGKVASRTATGAILGGTMGGVYGATNEGSDFWSGLGKGMLMGGATLGAFKGLQAMPKVNWSGAGSQGKGLFGKARGWAERVSRSSILPINKLARNYEGWGSGQLNKLINSKYYGSALSGVSGAVPGAMVGGGAGAVYGAFSDRESMISGAFKGAIGGAVAAGSYRAMNGKFAHLGKAVNRSTKTNSPVNPIASSIGSMKTGSKIPMRNTLTGKTIYI